MTGESFRCLACLGDAFLEGPHGGLSINFCCATCGLRYNDCIMFIQLIPIEGNEREWFKGKYYPRTNTIRTPEIEEEGFDFT